MEKVVKKKKQNKIALVMIIIAIIIVILSFYINLYVIPVYVLGIIISIILTKKSKIFYLIIIIYSICLLLSIILYICFKPKLNQNLIGIWNCSYNNQRDYVIVIKLNNKNQFMWSKYKDNNNNYITGKYEIKKIDKKDKNNNVFYYNIILDSNKYIENGKKNNNKFHKEYDTAINVEEEKMILASSDNMLLKCNKISTDNPIIE